jgi:DNA-binding NtrC family response regulator
VIVSAEGTPERVAELARVGPCSFLPKPFGVDDLLAAVDGALARA